MGKTNLTIKVGINRTLFEKRKELDLSRKEASKKIGISKLYLTVLERGYIKLNEKTKKKIQLAYSVDDSFFYDNYEYPVITNEKLYEPFKINKLFDFISKNKIFKYTCLLLGCGFLAMTIAGVVYIPNTKKNAESFYFTELLNVRNDVLSTGMTPIEKYGEDSLISYKSKGHSFGSFSDISLNVYEKMENYNLTFFAGTKLDPTSEFAQRVKLYNRTTGVNTSRFHSWIGMNNGTEFIDTCYITCDVTYIPKEDRFNFSFIDMIKLNHGEGNKNISKGDMEYTIYSFAFESALVEYRQGAVSLFNDKVISTTLSYDQFKIDFCNSANSFNGAIGLGKALALTGLFLFVLFIGVYILAILITHNVENKLLKFTEELDEAKDVPVETNEIEDNKDPLPRNTWKNLFVPEFFVRAISLILLFVSSIATYFLFTKVVSNDIVGVQESVMGKELLSNLSVIAVMLLYFVKLDIYQNKKNAMFTSVFYLITGLLYYVAVVIVYYSLSSLSADKAAIANTIADVLPGNMLWGILVFNAMTIFMFAPVEKRYDTPKKRTIFRLMAFVPFSYLLASTIIFFGIKSAGWQIPFAVSSLFFYKAPMITFFAVFYLIGVFLFRRYTVKKYGKVNGAIYQQGNKYNYVRNAYAALIILVIGVVDVLFLVFYPNNNFGFGSNYLMLCAIPFILFYHPHIGKRNGTWDTVFNILYGVAYVAGIVLVVLAILTMLTHL